MVKGKARLLAPLLTYTGAAAAAFLNYFPRPAVAVTALLALATAAHRSMRARPPSSGET